MCSNVSGTTYSEHGYGLSGVRSVTINLFDLAWRGLQHGCSNRLVDLLLAWVRLAA